MEGDNDTHSVKGGVSEVRQKGFFLCNPNVDSGRKKVRYCIGEPFIVELDVFDHEHRRRHWVRHSLGGLGAQDADSGAEVVAIRLCKGDQSKQGISILGSHDGVEGGDKRNSRGGLVQLPFDGWAGVLEVG